MSATDKAFTGSIPENYDRYMVPLIFAPYAADLARIGWRRDRFRPKPCSRLQPVPGS